VEDVSFFNVEKCDLMVQVNNSGLLLQKAPMRIGIWVGLRKYEYAVVCQRCLWVTECVCFARDIAAKGQSVVHARSLQLISPVSLRAIGSA
jgi:hypothetical protein